MTRLITGDCVEVMAGMDAESVDAIVTDPPYGLEFMGRTWDGADGFCRSLNPAGVGRDNVFGRTSAKAPEYRVTGAVPQSGKRPVSDKPGAHDEGYRNMLGKGPLYQQWCEAWGTEALRITKPGGYLLAFGGTRTHHRLVCGLEDAGWIIRDELTWIYASGFPKGRANLKPAHEPIVLARKPGPLRALGIDECRIGVGEWVTGGGNGRASIPGGYGSGITKEEGTRPRVEPHNLGRWPSNVLLSDPELFDVANPGVVGSGVVVASGDAHVLRRGASTGVGMGYGSSAAGDVLDATYGDTGGYSRFFIVPKADRGDREPVLRGQVPEGRVAGRNRADGRQWDIPGSTLANNKPNRENVHPTVKPVDLMRHLVRLVTPPGGTVLDPFLGSGTTAIACEMEGFAWIGIEKEPEYVAIAEARLTGVQMGIGLA